MMSSGAGVVVLLVLVVAIAGVVIARFAKAARSERQESQQLRVRLERLEAFFGTRTDVRREESGEHTVDALGGLMALAAELTGADCAVLWRITGDVTTARVFSGRFDPKSIPDTQLALIRWAAVEGVVHVSDEARPQFAVVPAVDEEGSTGALAVFASRGLRVGRDELRELLPRLAEQASVLGALVSARREVQRQHAIARALLTAAQEFQSNRSLDRLGGAICATALELTAGGRAALVRWHAPLRTGKVEGTTDPAWVPIGTIVDTDSVVGEACREAHAAVWEDATNLTQLPLFGAVHHAPRSAGSLAVVPLERDLGIVGALVVEGDRESDVRGSDLRPLRLLAAIAAVSLEAQWEFDEVAERSRTDQLTGLSNRRHFDEQLGRMLAEADRFEHPVSLVLADVDHFKNVNDEYGHDVGDQVLKAVAKAIHAGVRGVDVCARFGGEEIAVLLPGTSLVGAVELADRLRKRVSSCRVRAGERELAVTVSLGVATYPVPVVRRDELFGAADRALYEAKRTGRDRVVAAT